MKPKSAIKNTIFNRLRTKHILILSAVMLLLFAILVAVIFSKWLVFPIAIAFLLVEVVLFWVYGLLSAKISREDEEKLSYLSGMTLDFLMELTDPVAILSAEGDIIWHNRAFLKASGHQNPRRERIQNIVDENISLRRLRQDSLSEQEEKNITCTMQSTPFRVFSYRVGNQGKTNLITVWDSLAKETALQEQLSKQNTMVAYIAVDNYTEADSFLQGNYRTVTAKIYTVLKEWADEMDAILCEVDNDRYFLVAEERNLQTLQEKQFDILDRIREISSDNVGAVVTASIGMSCVDGSMARKQLVAHQALDLALHRGGNQAVLKSRAGTEYFGGRNKTVQKKTKIRSRIIAENVKALIESSSNVFIMGHRFPDYDALGSCIGMARFAKNFTQNVFIIANTEENNVKFVINKLSTLPDYKGIFMKASDAQAMLDSSSLLIITDANNVQQFQSRELYENAARVVIIDHHRQESEYAEKPAVTYIEPNASSASELVAEMLEQQFSKGAVLKEEAELLFAGILLDTKQFTRNTGPRTFAAAQFLRSEGASPEDTQALFRTSLEDFLSELRFETSAERYQRSIVFAQISKECTMDDKIPAAKAADKLLTLEGVEASFVLCKIEKFVYISARSNGSINVQTIMSSLGGGGHFDMAATQIKDVSVEEAKEMLKGAIQNYQKNGKKE